MKIIKSDFKTFIKPTLLYVGITQVLLAISFNINKIEFSVNSLIMQYFVIFVTAICVIGMVVMTILFAIYFNTKSNSNHRDLTLLTDGYGLYRFIASLKILFIITLNFVFGFIGWGYLSWKDIFNIDYYYFTGAIFFLIPVLTLVVLSIAHTRQKKIFRNVEMVISLLAMLVGLYIAGNLYYFSNQQQGSAVLLILFIPLAISYMSIKDQNSQHKIYKIVIWIMCAIISIASLGLFVTSSFTYDTNYGYDQYQPETYTQTDKATTEVVDTEYGEMLYIDGSKDYSQATYALTTERYTYRLQAYSATELNFSAYELGSATSYQIYDSEGMTEPELSGDIYNPETNEHTQCSSPISTIGEDCPVDQEIIDVFNLMTAALPDQIVENNQDTIDPDEEEL